MYETTDTEEKGDAIKCIKFPEEILDNFNIVYNPTNSMFVLWNKYQLLIYGNFNFHDPTKTINPEFLVYQVLLSTNCLICIDCNGAAYTTSLKFKHSAHKRFKSCFHYRASNILNCIHYSEDYTLCLKYRNEAYCLCLYDVNAQFEIKKKIEIEHDLLITETAREKCILKCYTCSEDSFSHIKNIFKVEELKDNKIVICSFDKFIIFGCLIGPNMTEDKVTLIQLYNSPAEICDIDIVQTSHMDIVIGLTLGTIIKLSLNNVQIKEEVIHLNTALYKFIALNNTLFYTDGISLWKSEGFLSNHTIKFNKFFVNQVKDFVTFGDHIICTTYANLLYFFPIDDEKSFFKNLPNDVYCLANDLLNDFKYVHKINREIHRTNEVVKKVKKEKDYIVALSMCNRQDIMNNIIHEKILVYDKYEDVVKENPKFTLTEEIDKYFIPESRFFLITITTTEIDHVFNNLVESLFEDLKFHITLSLENRILKTTSIKITDKLKNTSFLIPLDTSNIKSLIEVQVRILIVSILPGVHDEKQVTWAILYRKLVVLHSEHFIKTDFASNDYISLKEPHEKIEDLIHKTVSSQYQQLFKFINMSKLNTSISLWSIQMKIPDNFSQLFSKSDHYKESFCKRRTQFFQKQFSCEEFLNCEGDITFEIGDNKVKLELDEVNLKKWCVIISTDMKINHNIRNFLSNILYNGFKNYKPGKEFVPVNFLLFVQKLEEDLKSKLEEPNSDGELDNLTDKFNVQVLNNLPL